jgi:squalene-hopene/tetraprenyl-beta-curcumene cyclase
MVLFLSRFPEYRVAADRAVEFLRIMQNDDGGWGAFARNNDGNLALNLAVKPMEDSADFFDESAPCVTGHILEALGTMGHTTENSEVVRKAVEYLKGRQDPDIGAWSGRWGINYLYGTSAAVVGLARCGESPAAPYLQKAWDWLKDRQHVDGSYGESTLSYVDKANAGVGAATASQTAWALIALQEGGAKTAANARAAARYLASEISRAGHWSDPSTVGTGHPGIVYMNYPSYPYAFPLIALARYAKRIDAGRRRPGPRGRG